MEKKRQGFLNNLMPLMIKHLGSGEVKNMIDRNNGFRIQVKDVRQKTEHTSEN